MSNLILNNSLELPAKSKFCLAKTINIYEDIHSFASAY